MSFNFPNTPTSGQSYTPAGGPTFTWDGVAWKALSQGVPVTVYVSDTAPVSPALGQLWWDSDSGNMFIWYHDGDSAQWIQVSGEVSGGLTIADAPSDGGEYVRSGGVWRLIRQGYNLTGLSTQTLTVPAWGPRTARLTMSDVYGATAFANVLRLSSDGTTFPGGASDYQIAGFSHIGAGTTVGGVTLTAQPHISLTSDSNNYSMPALSEAIIGLTRTAAAGIHFGVQVRGSAFNSSGVVSTYYYYIALATAFTGTGPIKALRWFSQPTVAVTSGSLTVEWLA